MDGEPKTTETTLGIARTEWWATYLQDIVPPWISGVYGLCIYSWGFWLYFQGRTLGITIETLSCTIPYTLESQGTAGLYYDWISGWSSASVVLPTVALVAWQPYTLALVVPFIPYPVLVVPFILWVHACCTCGSLSSIMLQFFSNM